MKHIKLFESFLNEEAKKEETYLFFNGNKLDFIEGGKVTKTWRAVSGRSYYHWYMPPAIWRRRYNLKPEEWSKYSNEGPTPPGNYTLGKTQERSSDKKWKTDAQYIKSVVATSTLSELPNSKITDETRHEFTDKTPSSFVAWGDYRWALKPSKGTDTHGRSSFYLHGGSTPGSIGCIDLVTESGSFADYYKAWQKKSNKTTIKVVIDYSTYNKDIPMEVASQPYKMSPAAIKDDKTWYDITDKAIKDTMAVNKIEVKPEVLKHRRA